MALVSNYREDKARRARNRILEEAASTIERVMILDDEAREVMGTFRADTHDEAVIEAAAQIRALKV